MTSTDDEDGDSDMVQTATGTVLVTGGFGFIGSHLVDRLLKEGRRVHVIDDLTTSPLHLPSYLATLAEHEDRMTYQTTAIADASLSDLDGEIDEIYHLASPVGPAGVLAHAGRMVQQVVTDFYTIAELAMANEARMLDVSTSEVYGGGDQGLCAESLPKIIPSKTTVRLEYAVAKLAAETAAVNLSRTVGLDVVIVRPFNVAGPRQSPRGGFVVPRFVRQAMAGSPLTVFGDGSAVRAFTHVGDVADGFMLAMRHGMSGVAYNIGDPAGRVTIAGLARQVVSALGSPSEIRNVDPKEIYGHLYEEAHDKFPDASLATSELGWVPKRNLAAIITETHAELLLEEANGVPLGPLDD